MKTHIDEQLVTNYLNPVRSPHHWCGSCLRRLASNGVKGDEKALEVLIKRYLKPIYSFTFRFVGNIQEAEDITQEVFVKVWRNLKKPSLSRSALSLWPKCLSKGFNPKKGSFKTWIFTIAKNTCIDWLKKKKTIPFSEFENEEGKNVLTEKLVDSSPLPDELFERANVGEMLQGAINHLAPKYRLVLFLRYNDHFTFREIAEVLQESLNTIKSQHRRALIKLKKLLPES